MLLAELRAQTKELHEQIEKEMPLMRADFSQAQYNQLLQRFLSFLQPLNSSVFERDEWLKLPGDWAARRHFNRIAALEDDLRYLKATNKPSISCPSRDFLLEVSEFPQAIGCAYVLEGSSLGGQVIARHLQHKFGLSAGKGASYFSGYGEATGARWKEFCAALEAYENSLPVGLRQTNVKLATDTACETFNCLRKWLTS